MEPWNATGATIGDMDMDTVAMDTVAARALAYILERRVTPIMVQTPMATTTNLASGTPAGSGVVTHKHD